MTTLTNLLQFLLSLFRPTREESFEVRTLRREIFALELQENHARRTSNAEEEAYFHALVEDRRAKLTARLYGETSGRPQ